MSGQIDVPNRGEEFDGDAHLGTDVMMPSEEQLALSYRVGSQSRALEEHIVRLVSRGEVKFAIWGVLRLRLGV